MWGRYYLAQIRGVDLWTDRATYNKLENALISLENGFGVTNNSLHTSSNYRLVIVRVYGAQKAIPLPVTPQAD